MSGPVVFVSDLGLRDEFVGVCHGVIARNAPGARVIDITHGVPRHDVRTAALVLRAALPYMPPGVHLAVVDPEVGSERRAVALRLLPLSGSKMYISPAPRPIPPINNRFLFMTFLQQLIVLIEHNSFFFHLWQVGRRM